MRASRRSVKTHQGFNFCWFLPQPGLQVYLSKCLDAYVSSGCTILVFFRGCSSLFQHVDLVTTSLRAGFQDYLYQPWVLHMQAKVEGYLFLGAESHFSILCFFLLVDCLSDGINKCGWLASCRRQGMLTQGPTADPQCKLNISSFVTLPHLLDCLICTRNSISIALLL